MNNVFLIKYILRYKVSMLCEVWKTRWIKISPYTEPLKMREIALAGVAQVDWAPACDPKGHRFDSQSGHMPGLWARCLVVGVLETTDGYISCTLMFLSLSLSFPSPPLWKWVNEIFIKEKENEGHEHELCFVVHLNYPLNLRSALHCNYSFACYCEDLCPKVSWLFQGNSCLYCF